jgi:ADP-ribosyl-[dinitrogen reductase] hydrolase
MNIRHLPDAAIRERFHGCLLGGAVGDALGAPVEFMFRPDILKRFGEAGIRDMVPAYGRIGAITDDTQMALFTAEGMLRSYVRGVMRGLCHPPGVIASAYQRWLHTQGFAHPLQENCLNGWLIQNSELFARRAPGKTCLSALQAMRSVGDPANNNSKGCGGVMRVAPVGMILAALSLSDVVHDGDFQQSFTLGCEAAGITHGHPTGQLASGAFAAIVYLLLKGKSLMTACAEALLLLENKPEHGETTAAIRHAQELASSQPRSYKAIRALGEGWIAEEALAIGLYCALCAADFDSGVVMAVNHDGDSDSTGLIAGHLLGAIHGVSAIPKRWLEPLELRTVIEEVADDLATCGQWVLDDEDSGDEQNYYRERYPGA